MACPVIVDTLSQMAIPHLSQGFPLDQLKQEATYQIPPVIPTDVEWDGLQYLDALAFSDQESSAIAFAPNAAQARETQQPLIWADTPSTPLASRLRWAFRWNHYDPFFGAKEARASPVVPQDEATKTPEVQAAQEQASAFPSSSPATTLESSDIIERIEIPSAQGRAKHIPRMLFPETHGPPRSHSNTRQSMTAPCICGSVSGNASPYGS